MPRRKSNPLDALAIGFLTGFILPILIFLGVYLFGEQDVPFGSYIKNLWKLQALIKLMSLCVFANLLVFMGFLRLKFDQAARGVLGATILYAIAVMISRAL
jgi:hypothetical protein